MRIPKRKITIFTGVSGSGKSSIAGPSNVFGFNHPKGMCPNCNGLGRKLDVDLDKSNLTQKPVDKPMMGRFMSLMALTEVGFTPISNALARLLADWNLTALFALADALLTVTALLAAMNGNLRSSEV